LGEKSGKSKTKKVIWENIRGKKKLGKKKIGGKKFGIQEIAQPIFLPCY